MKMLFSLTLGAGLLTAGAAGANPDMLRAKNCVACHATSSKIVGPAFREVAARYAGQKDAVEPLAEKILKGGSGAWGNVPMPSNNQLSEMEARLLAKWILSLK